MPNLINIGWSLIDVQKYKEGLFETQCILYIVVLCKFSDMARKEHWRIASSSRLVPGI